MQQSKLVIIINVSKLYPTSSHQWIIIVKKQKPHYILLWQYGEVVTFSEQISGINQRKFLQYIQKHKEWYIFIFSRHSDCVALHKKLDCEFSGNTQFMRHKLFISVKDDFSLTSNSFTVTFHILILKLNQFNLFCYTKILPLHDRK